MNPIFKPPQGLSTKENPTRWKKKSHKRPYCDDIYTPRMRFQIFFLFLSRSIFHWLHCGRAWKVVYLPGNTGPNFLAKCVILQTEFENLPKLIKIESKNNIIGFFFILKSYLYLLSPSFGSFSIGLSKYLLGFSNQIGLNFLVSAYLPGNAVPAFPILFRPWLLYTLNL